MKKYTVSASLSREDEKDFFTTKRVNSTNDDIPESTTTSSIYASNNNNNKQRRGIVHRSQTQLQANKQVQIIEELKEEEVEEIVQNKPTRPIGIKTTTIVEPSSVNDNAENSISDASVVSSVASSNTSSSVASSPMAASSVESNPSSSPIIKKKKFTFGGLIKRKQNNEGDASTSPTVNASASPNLNDSPNSTSTSNFESNSLPKRPQVISVNDGSDFRKKLQDRKRNAGGTGLKIVKQNDQLIVSQNNSTPEEE